MSPLPPLVRRRLAVCAGVSGPCRARICALQDVAILTAMLEVSGAQLWIWVARVRIGVIALQRVKMPHPQVFLTRALIPTVMPQTKMATSAGSTLCSRCGATAMTMRTSRPPPCAALAVVALPLFSSRLVRLVAHFQAQSKQAQLTFRFTMVSLLSLLAVMSVLKSAHSKSTAGSCSQGPLFAWVTVPASLGQTRCGSFRRSVLQGHLLQASKQTRPRSFSNPLLRRLPPCQNEGCCYASSHGSLRLLQL